MKFRFHLLGLAHTKTTKDFLHCLSDDTEIMTEDGWMLLSDLVNKRLEIKIATLNRETYNVEYQFPIFYHKYYYEGKMINWRNRSIDIKVTPGHMMWVRTASMKMKDAEFGLIQADKLPANIQFMKSFQWGDTNAESPPSCFVLPEYKSSKKYKPSKSIPLKEWLKFFGVYLAEGSIGYGKYKAKDDTPLVLTLDSNTKHFSYISGPNSNNMVSKAYVVNIAQQDEGNREIIYNLVRVLGFVPSVDTKGFRICDAQLAKYFEQFGHARGKYIPKEFKKLPREYLTELLNGLILGDGSKLSTGMLRYWTFSKRLADDVSELALKLGYTVTSFRGNLSGEKFRYCVSMSQHHGSFSSSLGARNRFLEDYRGYVYCVTVPNATIYVRRNGRSCWVGNCAYSQKVFKMGKMLTDLGHEVYHYGAEGSNLQCTEHITCVTDAEQAYCYEDRGWPVVFFDFNSQDFAYRKFNERAIVEINKRKQPNDILLCSMGNAQRVIADATNVLAVEMGIGYTGVFAKFRVFESYAWMHYVLGLYEKNMSACDGKFYDVVIPNYFDPEDFEFSDKKEDYYLYVGRIIPRKGVHVAAQVVDKIGAKLLVAGKGKLSDVGVNSPNVKYVGEVGVKERSDLMKKARAIFVPTLYLEPFGGVNVEAMFSGTPAITTDWGGFTETVNHGVTGYRCRTMDDFIWAAKNVDKLDPKVIREYAMNNYSLERVGLKYQEYFLKIHDIFHPGKGWYEEHPERTELDWLRKY